MKPAERRKRLFKDKRKPEIQEATYDELWKWVRLAERTEGREGSDEEFAEWLESQFAGFDVLIFISDINKGFASGFGPIGVVGITKRGDVWEPHVEWFPWANCRNRLRGSVQFFMTFRRTGNGTMKVFCSNNSEKFFRAMKKYAPLFYVGKIPGGDRLGRGDEFIFYMKGYGHGLRG